MKILYCGIDVYLPGFEYLADNPEHEIAALYTYHNEAEYIRDEQIVAAAARRGIPSTTARLSSDELAIQFQTGACDILLSAEYDRKLPIPAAQNFRGVNIYNSLLPEGRGYFPVGTRLYLGYDYGGVTIHKLTESFDRDDILLQEKFSIIQKESSMDVYQKSAQVAQAMVAALFSDFSRYWREARPQDEMRAVWWPLPLEADFTIMPHMTIAEIRHKFRSFSYLTRLAIDDRCYRLVRVECKKCGKSADTDLRDIEIDLRCREIRFRALDGIVTATYRTESGES